MKCWQGRGEWSEVADRKQKRMNKKEDRRRNRVDKR